MATKLCKFSEEMVVQILLKSRPKSLMRFKCVHKSWHNLIESPSFVSEHLSTSMQNETNILFKRTILKGTETKDEKELRAILFDPNSNKKEMLFSAVDLGCLDEQVLEIRVPPPMNTSPFSLEITGHCDGIICLKGFDSENIVLSNPALREFKLLPKSILLLPPRLMYEYGDEDAPEDYDFDDDMESTINCVGFGYDPQSKDYKVVRVVEFISGVFCQHPSRVELYTMSTNSWREIECDEVPGHVYWSPSFQMYLNGVYYWWAAPGEDSKIILAFDMSNERFHGISVPSDEREATVEDYGFYSSLAVWKESIVFMSYEAEGGIPKSIEMWVMDMDGLNKNDSKGINSWKKHLSIGPIQGVEIPLVFWESDGGDEVLMVASDGHVVSYNIGTQKLKPLPNIHGVEDPAHILGVSYVPSVLSLKGVGNDLESIHDSS